jgi:hypothetical protein
MKKIDKFLNSEKTFSKVLDILNQHGDMSIVGSDFVAGGSVANIIYHLIYGSKLIINDIDVYKRVNVEDLKKPKFSDKEVLTKSVDVWYPTTYVNEEGLEILDDNYGRTYVSETGARMRIVKHSRKGIFNNIDYIFEEGHPKSKTKKTKELVIIEGFDLNCCKAGIDITNGKIIYTPEFVEFLETKQMKVTNPCAPVQTTIRIYKKLKDIEGIHCDVKHEMLFLTVASKHLHGSQITKIIGPETKEKYDRIKPFIEQYFKIRKPEKMEEVGYGVSDRYFTNNKLNSDAQIWIFDPVLDFDIIENIQNINNLKRVWELLYTFKKKSEQDKINKIFYKNIFLGDMKEDQWTRRVYESNSEWLSGDSGYTDEPHYNSNRFTYHMILSKKDYYKCDFTLKHVDVIDKFSKEHYGVNSILKYCDNLTHQYNVVKYIKTLAKREGDWIIGLLENIDWNKYNNIFDGKITKEFISKIIESEKEVNSVELTTKIELSNFEYSSCVKELNTVIDLRMEGKKMGHCVGGYASSIKSEHSRIFHIDCDGIGSTIEVYLPEKEKYCRVQKKHCKIVEVYQPKELTFDKFRNTFKDLEKCIVFYEGGTSEELRVRDVVYRQAQHFGRYPEKGNLEPTATNKNVAKELIKYLNKNHLPKNYKLVDNNLVAEEENGIFV